MNPLNPLDAAMMTAELVSSPMHVGVVLLLSPPADGGPDYVENLYRNALVGNDTIDPRLRRYPHRGVDTGGIWVWRDIDTVDLNRHCLRRTVFGRDEEFWRLIGELDAERLDRSRPMWMSYLIDGLEGGRFAFYVKVHHTLIDGVAGFQMIGDALSSNPMRRSMPPFHADRGHGCAPPEPAGLLRRVVAPVRFVAGAVASGSGLFERVIAGELSTVVGSLVRRTTVLPLGAPFTRFNGRLGANRAVCGGSWAKSRIQALQRAAGVTGNDVINAVLASVLRRWLGDRRELPKQSLVAICPITVRERTRPGAVNDGYGNKFGLWLCPLGTNVDDPVARLALIHRSMSEGKEWVTRRGLAASLLTTAGSIAVTAIVGMLPSAPRIRTGYNVPISHVPGPRDEMYFNGAHIEEMYPVSAISDGQTLNITTCSYADRIGIGFVADADVVSDIDSLVPLTELCLIELETALGVRS